MSDISPELEKKAVDTIRFLAVDAVEKANSGHPGMPMGTAVMAFTLWSRYLRFNPQEPRWPNRDRFVLSAGHGSMLLYSLLHLAGFDVTMDDLKSFRQLHSKTPGHPEFGLTPGVEATTGPLGQGFANGVGMALSQRMMAARFNAGGQFPVDNFVYAICSDGDLEEGVASEAASLAGHLQLGNLIYLYDDNRISIEGNTDITFTEDRGRRFEAYGWHVQHCDGLSSAEVAKCIEAAQQDPRPSLLVCRTIIGFGAPHKANTGEVHGSPLGKDELKATKENLGWPLEPTFLVPDDVKDLWKRLVAEKQRGCADWHARFGAWQSANPALAAKWTAHWTRATPPDLAEQLADGMQYGPDSTRKMSQRVIQKAAKLVPALVGGSADLEPSTFTAIKDGGDVDAGHFEGRTFHFGVREHAMGSVVNGLAYDGAFIPYGSTFLLFSDYMRPPLRLAAISGLQAITVFTHDSIFLAEDGPTHQPIEQLAGLRSVPHLHVVRPCDGTEVAAAWAHALERKHGPTLLILSRQKVTPPARARPADVREAMRGAYTLVEPDGKPDVVLVSTGSEVGPALEAAKLLAGRKVRVVSMPCQACFLEWPRAAQNALLPQDGSAKLVAIEAALGLDWYRLVGTAGLVVGIDRYGASAPEKALADEYGFTPAKLAAKISAWLG